MQKIKKYNNHKEPTNRELDVSICKLSDKTGKSIHKLDRNICKLDKKIDAVMVKMDKKIDDVLTTMNAFATHTQKQFDQVDKRFDQVDKRFEKIESTMVTKAYLDDKLADLRGDLVVLTRKEDKKLGALIDVLHKREVISDEEVRGILAMEPFPVT